MTKFKGASLGITIKERTPADNGMRVADQTLGVLKAAWTHVFEYREGTPEWLEHAMADAASHVMAAVDRIEDAIDEQVPR